MERVRNSQSEPMGDRTSEELDLGALMDGIGRRKYWILGATLAAFLGGVVFVSVVSARYTGEAKVLLETQDSYFTRPGKDSPELALAPAIDPEAVQSQVQLVTSRDLARRAIDKLGLLGNPEFDPLAGGMTPLTRLLVILGLERDPREVSPEDRVLDSYFDRLTVFPVAKSRVLSIEFVSRNPEFAAKAANTIAELYLDMQEEAKRNTAKQAGAWLGPNIQELRGKVADAEAKVEAFRAKSGLLIGANNTTISAQQLADLTTQLAAARSAQAEAQAKAQLIRQLVREGRASDVSEVANNELIRGIAQQAVTLRAQLALESQTLLPGHPRIQELTAQLSDVTAALRAAAEKTARGLENDAQISGARVEALTATLESQKKTVASGNDDEVQLQALERDAAAARDQLEAYVQKYREATARTTDNSETADARIISRAIAPQLPSFPKKVPTVLISTLAGFFLSLGIVVTRELLSGRAHVGTGRQPAHLPESAEDLAVGERRSRTLASHEGDTPAASDTSQADHPESAGADEVRAAEAGKTDANAQTVLVCGIDATSGAGEAAIELGRTLSGAGRTIIIDFDRESGEVDALIGDGPHAGLAELVAGRETFSDVIQRDRGSRLHVLAAGQAAPGTADGSEHERLHLVLDALVATYDYVVLLGPPLADRDQSLDLAGLSDSVVLVTGRGGEDMTTEAAVKTLTQAGAAKVQVLAHSASVKEEELTAA